MINETIINYHLESKKTFMDFLLKEDSSGSYLLSGPQGGGKRSVALFLAKKLLSNPHKIDKEIHPDLFCLPKKNSKVLVEDIEEIDQWAFNRPFESERKIIIIHEAHNMSTIVQNKILKLLEEPPTYLLFFLISSSPSQLLTTTRSRCINVNFDPLPKEFLMELLKDKTTSPELINFSLYLLNGSINNIEYYTDKNLNDIINLTSLILNKNKSNLETLLNKVDKITKEKTFNQSFFITILIGAMNYALKQKNVRLKNERIIFDKETIRDTSNLSIVDLIKKLTYLNHDLKWSNFNFKMNFEDIVLDFFTQGDKPLRMA